MEKEIKINVPNGYEIDKENSTFECIKFKLIENKLPKTWKEFCKTHPRTKGECWIGDASQIESIDVRTLSRLYVEDRNLLPNKQYAEAMLALCQLIQLRDCYNDGWVPDWTSTAFIYCIYVYENNIITGVCNTSSRVLTFKTHELSNEFLTNFGDLIEIAKPLL